MIPTCKPLVDTRLRELNTLQRAVESFRYVLLSINSFISPTEQMRKWVRINARLAVFMAAPTFMAFPVITVALWEFEAWIHSLTTIASKLIFLPILALLALISIAIVLKIISVFIKR